MSVSFQIKGQSPVTLGHDIIKVGRDGRSHLVIDDENVARMHAVIEVSKESLVLIDLGNEPGTKVNGARVNKSKIKKGDVMLFGSTEVIFLGVGPVEERNGLVANLMESTGCSEAQAQQTLDNLAEKADNARWVYCDGKVECIRLIGQKIELADGTRHFPSDMGGFEELEQFDSEWDALEHGLNYEEDQLKQAEDRVKVLKDKLQLKPSTHGWRSD